VYSTVADLIAGAPLIVNRTDTVAEVARQVNERGLPCAVVDTADGGFGMVTDTVLRSRVVAKQLPLDTPASAVMDYPAPTTPLEQSAAEGLIDLLEHSAEYLLVTDRGGALRGVVAARDFVASPTTAGIGLHEQIHRAQNGRLISSSAHVWPPEMLAEILARGLSSDRVITVYSATVDATVRQAIQLVFNEQPDVSVDTFTWFSLGNNGRREAVPASDVDAAVAFDDSMSESQMSSHRTVFSTVNSVLAQAGISVDAHGACASKPPFSRTNKQWRAAAMRWLTAPEQNKVDTRHPDRQG
jgi:CBS domain-containing protein